METSRKAGEGPCSGAHRIEHVDPICLEIEDSVVDMHDDEEEESPNSRKLGSG